MLLPGPGAGGVSYPGAGICPVDDEPRGQGRPQLQVYPDRLAFLGADVPDRCLDKELSIFNGREKEGLILK